MDLLPLIVILPIGGTVLWVLSEDFNLPGKLRVRRRKPKTVQDSAAFTELYQWKKQRRQQERLEWDGRFLALEVAGVRTRVAARQAAGKRIKPADQAVLQQWRDHERRRRNEEHRKALGYLR